MVESIGEKLRLARETFYVKGVRYRADANDFSHERQLAADLEAIRNAGCNTVWMRSPSAAVLDTAWRRGLRVAAAISWSQDVAFLDDRDLARI